MFKESPEQVGAQANVTSLLGIIERFNESSAKLEHRHVELLAEIAELQEQLRS